MRHSQQGSAARWLICAALVLVVSVALAFAADTTSEAAPVANDAEAVQAPVLDLSAFMAFIDPETGEMRAPNEQEAAALAEALRMPAAQPNRLQARSQQAPSIEAMTLENGEAVERVVLDLSSVNVSVAVVQPDGSVKFECGVDHDHSVHSQSVHAQTTDTAAPADM